MRLILILSFLLILAACSTSEKQETADTVFVNGKIWTGDSDKPWAEWIAVKDGKIIAVGNGEDNSPQADSTVDLGKKLMVPGFNDSHVHFASAGSLLLGINLLDVNSEESFRQRVIETTQRLPEGSWITRGDWGAYEAWSAGSAGGDTQLQEFEPHRDMIDDLTTGHPVLVTRYDRKMGLANQVALDYLGIESDDGILKGQELRNALESIPEKSYERKMAEARRALEECRKWGVTTVQDMSPLDRVDVYTELQQLGELTCRINFSPSRLSDYKMMSEEGWTIAEEDGGFEPSGDDWISFGTLKTHIDGIMGARTARFFSPYSDNSMEMVAWRGGWREFSQDMPSFKEMILDADRNGIQLRIHAIGDEANSILLDILDTLHNVNGERERRFRLVHAQVIHPDDFPRFSEKKIVAEVQPYHVTDDMRWMEERIGYERCKGAYAFKTLRDHGCVLSFGSDWPGTNASYYPINPLMGLFAAVTRQTVNGEPEEGWFPDERIGLEEALKAYTWGGAFGAFEEHRKGTIEPGKMADLTVLDTDLFETEPSQWLEAQVEHTIVDGKIVYSKKGD